MKKSLLKGISVCLVLICIFSMLLSPSVYATSKSVSKEKINPHLSEVLSEADSKDTVQVSIWFDDIDQDGIIEKTKQSFVKAKSRSSSDTSAIEILDIDTKVDSIDAFRDDTYAGDVQEIIGIKRNYLTSAYKDYNNQQKAKIMDILSLSEKNIVYVSSLAPNIEANLTKSQIYELSNSDFVTDIYAVEEINYSVDVTENTETRAVTSTSSATSSYSQHIFSMTGVDFAREAFQLTGHINSENNKRINVGIFDESYLDSEYIEEHFRNVTVETFPTIAIEDESNNETTPEPTIAVEDEPNDEATPDEINPLNINNHTYSILSIISGYLNNNIMLFKGGVPNANIFVSNQNDKYYNTKWKECIEWLVSKDCNVINMSRHMTDGELDNIYGENAKWIDHIAVTHNVHIVMATGNCSYKNSIKEGTLAHNAIGVGSVRMDGSIEHESAYSMRYDQPYKPEVVAPGTDIYLPTTTAPTRGTSYAAPVVTCAVAQLCDASAILMYNPPLMKAVIMSGAKHNNLTQYIKFSEIGNTEISLGRECGAGMLYVPNSYRSFVNKGNYFSSVTTPYSIGVHHDAVVEQTGKVFKVVAAWDKMNVHEDEQDTGEEGSCEETEFTSKELDQFYLSVRTPSGAVYTSRYDYDNKQAVSFITEETGTYRISFNRYGTQSSQKVIRYGVSYTLLDN